MNKVSHPFSTLCDNCFNLSIEPVYKENLLFCSETCFEEYNDFIEQQNQQWFEYCKTSSNTIITKDDLKLIIEQNESILNVLPKNHYFTILNRDPCMIHVKYVRKEENEVYLWKMSPNTIAQDLLVFDDCFESNDLYNYRSIGIEYTKKTDESGIMRSFKIVSGKYKETREIIPNQVITNIPDKLTLKTQEIRDEYHESTCSIS